LRALVVADATGQVVVTGSDRDSVQVTERISYPDLPPAVTR
jgi:hypothetical protein